MKLNDITQRMMFDSRVVERNLKNKAIKKEDLEKHLASLPDSSANVRSLSVAVLQGEESGYENQQ